MAKINSSLEGRIPRFVSDRNDAAERAGLDVVVDLCIDEDSDGEIMSVWTGTWAQHVATGMIPRPIKLPVRDCALRTPFVCGRLTRQENDIWQLKRYDRLPVAIKDRAGGAIQEMTYAPYDGYKRDDVFHGRADVLLREGIVESPRHIPKGLGPSGYWRTRLQSYQSQGSWACALLFDGTVLYNIEERDTVRAPRCLSEFEGIRASRNKTNLAAARADVQFQSMMQRLTRNDRPAP